MGTKGTMDTIPIKTLADFKILEQQLIQRWLEIESKTTAFQYKLNVQKQKFLDGKFNYFLQV